MKPDNKDKLWKLTIGIALVALVAGAALGAAEISPAAIAGAFAIVIFIGLTVLRRKEIGRWGYRKTSWTGAIDGKAVEVVFDERGVVLNRIELMVDGSIVDKDSVWYGTKMLSGDGITATVGSGWVGECLGVLVTGAAGTEQPLTPQT